MIWNVTDERWSNVGMNYVFRPPWLESEDVRLFAYTGTTNLFGLSHQLSNGCMFSWGGGASTVHIEPVDLRWSAGAFYEHNDSLLASIVTHSTAGYAVRANLYPA